jgi:hypothetical protein
MKWKTIVLLFGIVVIAAVFFFFWPTRTRQDQALQTALAGILNDYRKIIVLMDGAGTLDEATHARCITTGQVLFWRKQRSLRKSPEICLKARGTRRAWNNSSAIFLRIPPCTMQTNWRFWI